MKTTIINVLVTFVEGFLATWAITGNATTTEALGGAVAAGASLTWNAVVKPLRTKIFRRLRLRNKGVKI